MAQVGSCGLGVQPDTAFLSLSHVCSLEGTWRIMGTNSVSLVPGNLLRNISEALKIPQ